MGETCRSAAPSSRRSGILACPPYTLRAPPGCARHLRAGPFDVEGCWSQAEKTAELLSPQPGRSLRQQLRLAAPATSSLLGLLLGPTASFITHQHHLLLDSTPGVQSVRLCATRIFYHRPRSHVNCRLAGVGASALPGVRRCRLPLPFLAPSILPPPFAVPHCPLPIADCPPFTSQSPRLAPSRERAGPRPPRAARTRAGRPGSPRRCCSASARSALRAAWWPRSQRPQGPW